MIVTGITAEQFAQAVEKAGTAYGNNLAPYFGRAYSDTRNAARVVLKTTGYRMGLPNPQLAPGQRRTSNQYLNGRRINAVCWHAYRDVLIEVFNINSDARVYTAMAKYRGRDEFYRMFPATGEKNIGSMAYPVTMPDTCDCDNGQEFLTDDEIKSRASLGYLGQW